MRFFPLRSPKFQSPGPGFFSFSGKAQLNFMGLETAAQNIKEIKTAAFVFL